MKVEIVAKEAIKPSSITSQSFNLSFLDQISPPVYVKLFFFYQNSDGYTEQVVAERSRCLKQSLSEVLSRFYPFAGRIKDKVLVCLNEDGGAEFLEARADCTLSNYLEEPKVETFAHLVPSDFWEPCTGPLLMVQASFFKCGGLAIGMNFSHKVSDAATFTSFINSWANAANGKPYNVVNPDFSGSLIFPSMEKLLFSGAGFNEMVKLNTVTRRFMFLAPQIIDLQEKASKEGIRRPSRIETISAFIWQAGMKMSILKAGGSPRPSVLLTPVNIRRRLPPPICDQSFGNLVESLVVPTHGGDTEMSYLISLLREKIAKSREDQDKKLLQGEESSTKFLEVAEGMKEFMLQPDVLNAFSVTSWSKFPFYEADFGWGKPTWVATHNPIPHITVLMDTRDGTGVEAWVTLAEEDMAIFASDEELLTYATPDPSPLNL